MLSGLHHPCLTRCLESFVDQDKNQLFIVMPHYASGDLSKIIKKNKTRSSRFELLHALPASSTGKKTGENTLSVTDVFLKLRKMGG
jgi:serine/threonine protein kinase